MNWISENWVWVLLFGAFIAMHLFGHGHGGHGSHGRHGDGDSSPNGPKSKETNGDQSAEQQRPGHQH